MKTAQSIRYQVAPESLVSIAIQSDRYKQMRLINYPPNTEYPSSSKMLKSLMHWAKGKPTAQPEHTLLYRLVLSIFVGFQHEKDGEYLRMTFKEHRYCKKFYSLPVQNMKILIKLLIISWPGKKPGQRCYCGGSNRWNIRSKGF